MPVNRRRSVRIPQFHLFRFSELHPNKRGSDNQAEETWTIDVSEHGMRFASYRYLPPNTRIQYTVEGESRGNLSRGQGKVIWSEPLENTQLFHAGIAFSE